MTGQNNLSDSRRGANTLVLSRRHLQLLAAPDRFGRRICSSFYGLTPMNMARRPAADRGRFWLCTRRKLEGGRKRRPLIQGRRNQSASGRRGALPAPAGCARSCSGVRRDRPRWPARCVLKACSVAFHEFWHEVTLAFCGTPADHTFCYLTLSRAVTDRGCRGASITELTTFVTLCILLHSPAL